MDDDVPPGYPVSRGAVEEHCYRHPDVITGVHCTRCGNAICPECMIPAPVGHQCPDCVDRARKEFQQSGSGPQQVRSMEAATATYVLLALIGLGYVAQLATKQADGLSLAERWGVAQPLAISHGEYWRLITPIFLHGSLIHLLSNGWGLYLFGSFVERTWGKARYLGYFFLTGIVAGATSYALSPVGGICTPALGASGAVFGLFGVFIAYNYRRRHTQLGRAMLQQMMPWLLLNIVISLTPGIDWKAHLGGLLAGFFAGFASEEISEKTSRSTATWVVSGLLVAVAVALVVVRTPAFREVWDSVPAFCNLTS